MGILEGRGSTTAKVVLRETAPSRYTATVPARSAGSYGLTLDLPPGLGGRRRVLVDVPYPAEYLPSAAGRSTLAEVVTQAGGSLLPRIPGDPLGAARSWRTPLLALALVLFLLSVATRLLVRSSRRPRAGAPAREREERPREPPLTRR